MDHNLHTLNLQLKWNKPSWFNYLSWSQNQWKNSANWKIIFDNILYKNVYFFVLKQYLISYLLNTAPLLVGWLDGLMEKIWFSGLGWGFCLLSFKHIISVNFNNYNNPVRTEYIWSLSHCLKRKSVQEVSWPDLCRLHFISAAGYISCYYYTELHCG